MPEGVKFKSAKWPGDAYNRDPLRPLLCYRHPTFLILNFALDVIDSVGRLDLQGDGLASQSLDEDLHDAQAQLNRRKLGSQQRSASGNTFKVRSNVRVMARGTNLLTSYTIEAGVTIRTPGAEMWQLAPQI